MTVPNTNVNSPATLTPNQARALLQTLVTSRAQQTSSPPKSSNPRTSNAVDSRSTVRPKQSMHSHLPRQIITIDASTHIMGHCNNVQVNGPSAAEQAAKIMEMLGSVCSGEEAKMKGGVNVSVQAGVSITGSRNFVILGRNGEARAVKQAADGSDVGLMAGGKRKADECLEGGPSVKKERVEPECK